MISTVDSTGLQELCGRWMPRKKAYCARKPGHLGECRTAQAMADRRERLTDRRREMRRSDDPSARSQWNQAYKMSRYGLTQEQFDEMLTAQGYACAMCQKPFAKGQLICIDHDHECCPTERRSCGKCRRGLLCVSCNTALGIIESKYAMARAYLSNRPAVRRDPLAETA